MNFTAKDVQALRERTGAGMMDCKKALVETDGDIEKAIDFLREKGLAKAAKKEGRIAAEGLVDDYREGNVAALVEVNCETDFVAKTDRFKAFVKTIAKQVVEANPADLDALMASEIEGTTVQALQTAAVAEIGEKISVRRFVRMEGAVDTYIHFGGHAEINRFRDAHPCQGGGSPADRSLFLVRHGLLHQDKSVVSLVHPVQDQSVRNRRDSPL